MSLIKDYFAKTETYKIEYGQKTIILMQVGAFFEVYGLKNPESGIINGSNIMDFSVICDLNVVDKKVCVGNFDVVMAGFKTNFIDKFVKKLQDSGYTTVVITQDENMPNVRDVLGIYSPGTYFPDNITNELTNNCCCIWIEHTSNVSILKKLSGKSSICVGVGNIDIFTGKTTMFEFQETYLENPTTFDELERFISIYNPSETIIIANLSDDKINNIIKYANIRSQSIHKVSILNNSDISKNNNIKRANNCEKQTYQRELLTKFYKVCDFSSFIQIYNNYPIATQAFCYLLDFVFQHNPGLVNKISEPNFESFGNRLILANHSLKQLNIIEDSNINASGKYSSVSKMLNECITSMGKRKFTQIFLNPITNETELENEYALTEYLLLDVNKCKIVRSLLTGIRDLTKLGRQIILRKVTPKALYQLYNNIISIKNLYINHISFDNIIINYLSCKIDISNLLVYCDSILEYLNKNLDIELCKDIDTLTSFDINFIKSGVSIDLDTNNILLDNSLVSLNYCKDYFNELITKFETNKKLSSKSKSKAKSITIVENDNEDKEKEYIKIYETDKTNIMLVATDARCKKLKELLPKDNNNSNIIFENGFELCANVSNIEFYKQSASANTISSLQINQLCKTVSQSKHLVKDLICKAFLHTVNGLDNFIDGLENIGDFITYIDVGYCKAWLSDKYHYCRPTIIGASESSFIDAKGLRHCLIEQLQCEELYVANDIHLSENGILLYGTNAVGKTSFIRAIGISIIMAQAGLFVPSSSFKYKPYKYIFTRILGNDNLFEGLSTFAVEMSELRTILKLADKNSLVLGDELCSGTESISATSIFVAGIKQLYDKQSSFIFATHLHEIISYDEITKMDKLKLKHMAVIYDRERDCLIYDRRLQDGPGNNMYGLEVCKSLGLPEDFLELANNIRLKYNPESSSILNKKGSSYNTKQLKTICEKCGTRPAKEVHHLAHQQDADKNGIIKSDDNSLMFHKNNKANLVSLCEECHDSFHSDNKKTVTKKIKTTKGTIVQEISININN